MNKEKINGKVLFAAWGAHNKKWHTYQLFDSNLRRLFDEVITFDPQEETYKGGKEKMNKDFLSLIEREKPKYIFLWLMYDEFDLKTLQKMNKILPDSISFCYNGDDDYKFYNYTIHYFPFIDYFLTTQPQYLDIFKKYGKEALFSCGSDVHEFKPLNLKKKYDVSFVGTPKNDRVEQMRYLLNNGIKIAVCGAGWEKYPEFKESHLGEIKGEEFIKLINESKISICLSKNYFGGTHILERFFEINSCKSFCLTEHAEGYFPLFKEGLDIATFKSKEELLEKTKYYLKNEKAREKITLNAYKKTIKSFSNTDLLLKAIKTMQKVGKKVGNETYLPEKKIKYLSLNEISNNSSLLGEKLRGFDYVGFNDKKYEKIEFKDFLQIRACEITKKPVSICDSYLSSSLIGDYASLCNYYAFDYKKREYLDNLDLAQMVVKKEYFLKNLKDFVSFLNRKNLKLINKDNSLFISLPLVRTKMMKSLPLKNFEHILFLYTENELVKLRNQNKLISSSYVYRLMLYTLLNWDLLKITLTFTLRRTKIKRLIKLSDFLEKYLIS